MNAPLRINEALLIADRAFQPFQCVAWHDGNGALSLSVIDRTNTRIGSQQLDAGVYSDPTRLENLLLQARAELDKSGYQLQTWAMPK
ncbi:MULTISPECIES: hypothetical protein [unclassified Pseudomonas]|uniref:hypothetical protein n=1 Tax=unclassified Pseudomonas TaxID=196821 RepID=UPI0008B84B52|nr:MULTISPECIES: hypothetical protein [unclassified Pseudomonas]SEU12605.1 hypothetical protein SAMN03159512_05255 [Pseudomonas sp. NFR09]SFB37016.1 hypothetical protein SAMN03159485_04882 [Pseudomonas sp. NFPP24]